MTNAVINNSSEIGEQCNINSGSIVEQDNRLREIVTIAPVIKLGGKVIIGRSSVVSIGSTVLHNISIRDYTVVGVHSLVNKALPNNVVAYRVPANIVRKRRAEDRYI